ncbi:unnamed protein product, partial [Ceratitis capitata]
HLPSILSLPLPLPLPLNVVRWTPGKALCGFRDSLLTLTNTDGGVQRHVAECSRAYRRRLRWSPR